MHRSLLRQAVITLIFMALNRKPGFPPPKFLGLEVDHVFVPHAQSTEMITGRPVQETVVISAATPCIILWFILSHSPKKTPFFLR
jgi:hypothetical protein